MRLDQFHEGNPRHQAVHASQKGRFAGGLAEGFKARAGHRGLHHRLHGYRVLLNDLQSITPEHLDTRTCSAFPYAKSAPPGQAAKRMLNVLHSMMAAGH